MLRALWLSRFSFDLDAPLSPQRLAFLRRWVSAPLFENITRKLNKDLGNLDSGYVDWWDIRFALNRKQAAARLQEQVWHDRARNAAIMAQRAMIGR